jgi:hypothetical protein
MALSLQDLCVQKLAHIPEKQLKSQLNWLAYNHVEAYKIQQGFDIWSAQIRNIEFELNIADMLIEKDMEYGDLVYRLNVKMRDDDEWYVINEMDDDYEKFWEIAEKRGLIKEIDEEDYVYKQSEFDEKMVMNLNIYTYSKGRPIDIFVNPV